MYIEDLNNYLEHVIIEEYKEKCKKLFSSLDLIRKDKIEELNNNSLLEKEEYVSNNLNNLKKIIFPSVYRETKIKLSIKHWLESNMANFNIKLKVAEEKKKRITDDLLTKHEEAKIKALNKYNTLMTEYKNKLSDLYHPIYLINENKDKVEKFASEFNIDLCLYSIDFKNMSLEEIKEIAHLADKALNEVLFGIRGISSLLKFLRVSTK